MEFEVQPEYTVEDFAAFWYGFADKRPGHRPIRRVSDRGMRLAGWLLLAVGGLLLAVYVLECLPLPGGASWMGAAFLLVGALTLVRRRPDQPRGAVKAWKNWQAQGVEEHWRYRFTPEGMEMHSRSSDHRYDYGMLRQVWQDEGHFYLTLDRKGWHILNKSQFTKGDPGRFAAFLKEQTGLEAAWVNGPPAGGEGG